MAEHGTPADSDEPDDLDLILAVSRLDILRNFLALLEAELAHPNEAQARAVAVMRFHAESPPVQNAPPEQRGSIFSDALAQSLKDDPELEQAIRYRMQRETLRHRMRAHLAEIEAPPDQFEA